MAAWDGRAVAAGAALAAGRYEEALVELDRAIFVQAGDAGLYRARADAFMAVSDFGVRAAAAAYASARRHARCGGACGSGGWGWGCSCSCRRWPASVVCSVARCAPAPVRWRARVWECGTPRLGLLRSLAGAALAGVARMSLRRCVPLSVGLYG